MPPAARAVGGVTSSHALTPVCVCAQNSTLVLTADTRSRDPKEPDGSAATLWGKINPKSFGNRVQFSKPGSEGDAKRCAPAKARREGSNECTSAHGSWRARSCGCLAVVGLRASRAQP
jgi:pre-mRNA-splicing helicase BRR2